MTRQLVEIHPTELKFIFELKKQSSCSIQLFNTSDQYIAYKVKTTSPKKYCVRPNVGVVSPHSPCEIIVTMQGQRTAPPDMQCKDKFLVQSTVVPEGTTMDQITSNMFTKENGGIVDEKKLKVALISPPHSPVLQPISGVTNQEPVFGTPKPVEQDNSSSEDSHEDSPPPPPQTVPRLSLPVEELKPKVTEAEVRKLEMKLNEADVGKPTAELTEADVGKPTAKLTEADVEKPTAKLDVEKLTVKLNEADIQKLTVKLNEADVEELKSKLDEAEKIIRSLREEKNAIIQQQESLRQELMVAKRRSPQVRAGYPFLFVCFIGLVGLIFGRMLSS
ncbi:vesicle-associated protein 1-2-like [Nymphaea colorata]|nr:vesicle-associated protein 1-2-like [Nymphaea colorata]XP_049933975.1 vesicle-associated protein 1-2-like [Nymphaea colorata]XP_049933976.1 vesicle-associated protein 1-2-like [Nymphaea colorata]